MHVNSILFYMGHNDSMMPLEDHMINRYVSICNQALFKNAERFPFKQILDAAEQSGCDRKVEARVSDDPEKQGFILRLKERKIQIRPCEGCGDDCCDYVWDIPLKYLEDVIAEPDLYISNPAKLDWGWLYHKS